MRKALKEVKADNKKLRESRSENVISVNVIFATSDFSMKRDGVRIYSNYKMTFAYDLFLIVNYNILRTKERWEVGGGRWDHVQRKSKY